MEEQSYYREKCYFLNQENEWLIQFFLISKKPFLYKEGLMILLCYVGYEVFHFASSDGNFSFSTLI